MTAVHTHVAVQPTGLGRVTARPPSVPPAGVPLVFLAAAGVGLVGFGVALTLVASTAVVAPNAPAVVAAVHLGMLAFLSTAVLGAMHQFAPVIAARPLHSTRAAYATAAVFVPAVWTLALGFATGNPGVVSAGGAAAFCGIALAVWNLSGPLSARGKGTTVLGLRLALGFLVLTAAFGVTYAFDRQASWCGLLPRRVLAHAHLGLLGWLGLAYVAVAEKLWPMFLLAPDQAEQLRAQLYGLSAILTLHFHKEEDVLLPVLDAKLSADDAKAMFADMVAVAHPHTGDAA